jgi:hypothetical protein
MFLKHQAFREEREFRVSVQRPIFPGLQDDEVKFRIRNGIPTPHILLFDHEFDLAVQRIVVGPNRSAKERLYGFSKFVARRGLPVLVDLSNIPFV